MRIRAFGMCSLALALSSTAPAQVTQRVSVSSSGEQANNGSYQLSISSDGRFVAFESRATNLVPGDTNGFEDVFVHDRLSGATERVSVSSSRAQGDGTSGSPSVSADGRFVAFDSWADNLVAGDTNGSLDVFVRDRLTGTTERVSVGNGGEQGDSASISPSISASGRYVAFLSYATNLVLGDTNQRVDVFVHDRQDGTTERVNVDSNGVQANNDSWTPLISADGRWVGFTSPATNLVPGDTNDMADAFVHDRQSGATTLESLGSGGVQGNQNSGALSMSSDGRYVVFFSFASNLVTGDTNNYMDVFVRDRQSSTTERVSISSDGAQGNGPSGLGGGSITADGRYVVFASYANTFPGGSTHGTPQCFVRDRQNGTTEVVSVSSSGVPGPSSDEPCFSDDGRFVAFRSDAPNLVPGDTNGVKDVFVRDRAATGFTSACDPGVGDVIACPCSNPPSGPGRGCDNSTATGGAHLSAAGIAYLSMDSLVFTTSGETTSALSIVMQGNADIPGGVVYGQGVRCLGGTIIRRLFIKQAVGGSITAPDLAAGDPQVTARSAAKGDVIQPGQSRWYLVYYRDPTVLGGCPATSTFNATQTGRVDWSF